MSNALGVGDRDIEWEGATRSVILSPDGVTVRLVVDSDKLSVDGEERTMDVTPLLRDGRVFLPARWVAEALGYEVKWDEAGRALLVGPPGNLPAPPAGMSGLPVVGDYENLKNLLAQAQAQGERALMDDAKAAPQVVEERNSFRAGAAAPGDGAGAADYSGTNVQVAGVDEADIVKTDGSYIYQVNGQRIVIARAYPTEEMKLVSSDPIG